MEAATLTIEACHPRVGGILVSDRNQFPSEKHVPERNDCLQARDDAIIPNPSQTASLAFLLENNMSSFMDIFLVETGKICVDHPPTIQSLMRHLSLQGTLLPVALCHC